MRYQRTRFIVENMENNFVFLEKIVCVTFQSCAVPFFSVFVADIFDLKDVVA